MNAPTGIPLQGGTPQDAQAALAGAAPVQHPHEDPPSATGGSSGSAVTNTAFIKALFSTLPEGQCNALTNFKDYSRPNWNAKFVINGYPDYPEENAYYCPSSLIGESRTLDHFAALHVVVVDDPKDGSNLPAPTYAIETSEGNYQLGYKLAEPLTDVAMAQAIHNSLHLANYCDKSGNNPVRWIRLPVGMNTKPGKMFKHRLVVWEPERTFTVEQLVAMLGLQVGQAQAQAPTQQPARAQAEQTVALPAQDLVIETIDAERIAHLRSALAFLAALNLDGYDHWQRWGSRLRCLGEVGYSLWVEASTKSPKFNALEAAAKWPKLGGERTGYKKIFAEAQDRGWLNPNSNAARDPSAPAAPIPEWVVGDLVGTMNKRQAEEKAAAAGWKLLTDDDLMSLPRLVWIVKNLVPARGIGTFYGSTMTYKSFLMLDMLFHIANGMKWFGHRVKKTCAVYTPFEGKGGVPKRVQALRAKAKKLGMTDTGIKFLLEAKNLRDPNDRANLIALLKAEAPHGIVCIDTLAQAGPGIDENGSEGMGEMIAIFQEIAEATGWVVVAIHHAGKNAAARQRGHSSLEGALDFSVACYRTEEEKDADGGVKKEARTYFENWKVKDAASGSEYPFDVEVVLSARV